MSPTVVAEVTVNVKSLSRYCWDNDKLVTYPPARDLGGTDEGVIVISRSRPTMQDVGARAGVSLKTVSRVVNAERGVSDALVVRVRQALKELDYRHNLAASNLRRGSRTMAVGVLVQDISNDYSSMLLRAIEDRVRTRGIAVFAASLDEEEEREREMATALVSRRVDGLILMPCSRDLSYLQNDIRAGLAVVAVDRPPAHLDVDSVSADSVAGSRMATRHLLEYGHRRIAFLGNSASIATSAARRRGYATELKRAGVQAAPDLVRLDLSCSEAAADAVAELLTLPDPPTAIVAGYNIISIGAIRALRDRALTSVVALVGFDDLPMADLVHPALTVIRQDAQRIGSTAADLLLARIDGDTSPSRRVVVPTTLVPRGSGEIPLDPRPRRRQ